MHRVLPSTSKESKLSEYDDRKHFSRRENEPRKTLVRNFEVKYFQNVHASKETFSTERPESAVATHGNDSDNTHVMGSVTKNIINENELGDKCLKIKDNEKSVFSEPRLFTSLKVVESIQNITEKGTKTIKIQTSQSELCSRKKINKQVNIPFEERVYKGLIDLHVSDEDVGLFPTHPPLKSKEFIKSKEPEPRLSDFYQPSFDKEYVVKPNIPKFEGEKIYFEQKSSVLKTSRQWEPENLNYY